MRWRGDFAENGKQDPVQVFDSFTRDLFVELASQDELSLNYTLADPQVYGITKADSAFSSYSVEEMEKDRELDKEILSALKGIKEDDLTEEQRITYRILTEMLKGEGAGKGLELYEEPLNTVTGDASDASGTSCRIPFLWKAECGYISWTFGRD